MNSAPDGNRYAAMIVASRVREKALFPAERVPSELELQARWFAGDFGTKFRSTSDDEVEVVQFGTWNREAGPDFSDAAIRINGTETIGGSVEFDVTDRNWELHKHAVNPAFDETILHVFLYQGPRRFFTRQARIAMCCKCASILRICRRNFRQTFRWPAPVDVRRL